MNKRNKAKKVPIVTLYSGQLITVGKVYRGKCLFHEDNNPSFVIYPETNSWFCFAGCGGGDSINFWMKLRNIDFRQALEELANDC